MIKYSRSIFIFLICLLVIGTTVFIFFPKAIEWKIKSYIQDRFDSELDYEIANWSYEGLTLNRVSIKPTSDQNIGFLITVDTIQINYRLDVLNRNIFVDVDCTLPKIYLKKQDQSISPYQFFESKFLKENEFSDSYFIAFKKTPKIHLFDSIIKLNVSSGEINLRDSEYSSQALTLFSFQATFGSKKEILNKADLLIGDDQKYLSMSISDDILLNLHEFDASNFFKSLELFFGKPFGNWVLKKADVSGFFSLKQGRIEGDATFKDLSIEHTLSGIGGSLPEVAVHCSPKASFSSESLIDEIIKNTFIEIKIEKKASLYRFKQGLPYWLLRDIKGTVSVNKVLKQGLRIDLDGLFFFTDKEDSKFILRGNFPLSEFDDEGDLLFQLSSKLEDNVSLNLIVQDRGFKGRDFDLSLNNIGPREYEAVRNLWPEWSFVWEEAQFLGGKISLHLKGNILPSSSLSKLSVEKLIGSEVWFKSSALSTEGYLGAITGNIDFIINRNESYLSPRNGQLSLSDGDFYWESKSLYDGKESLGRLNHFNCKLKLTDGILQASSFKGNLGGLEAELDFLGLSSETVAKMKVTGLATKVVDILPGLFANKLKKSLGREEIAWQGVIEKKDNGLFLNGSLHMSNPDLIEQALVIEIGAFLEKLPKKVWEDASVKWKKWGISLLEKEKENILPFQRRGSSHILRVNWLKDIEGSWGVALRQGTFSIKNLSFKRWVEPFLAKNLNLSLSGLTTLYGDFNDRSLIVNFDLSNFLMDSSDFKVAIDQIRSFERENDTLSDPFSFIYFDFQDETVYGFMPIQKASYLEKATNLAFDSLSGLLSLSQNHLQLSQIQTISEGVTFKGDFDADFSSKEALSVVVKASDVQGSISNVQKFCAHFGDYKAWTWPITGFLSSNNEGVIFEAFVPFDERKSLVNWSVSGSLKDGNYQLKEHQLALFNMGLNFSYSSKDEVLNIADVSTTLKTLNNDKEDTYHLVCPYITYSFSENPFCNFDTKLEIDGTNSVWGHLQGNIQAFDNTFHIALDPKISHIGGFYPKISECVFDKTEGFKILKARPLLVLDQLTEDLKRVNAFNFFPIFLKTQIDNLEPETKFSGDLIGNINVDKAGFSVDIEGDSVKKNNKPIDKCFFKAFSEGHLWLIKDCRFGSFSLQANLQKEGDEFLIDHLSMRDEGIAIEGTGNYKNKQLILSLISGHIQLEDLKVSKNFHLLSDNWHPKGKIDIMGALTVNFTAQGTDPTIDWKGIASLNDLEIRGNRFKNQNAIPITFSEIDGLKLQDIALSVKQAGDIHYKTNLNLKGAHYDLEEETLKIEGLGFSLSTSGLNELVNLAEDFFPSIIDEETSLILKDIKRNGGVEGLINILIARDEVSIGITLSDGVYTIFGKEHKLNKVYLGYEKDIIIAKANYQFNNLPIMAELKISKLDPNKGSLLISETKDKPPLKILWHIKDQSFDIESVEGSFAGIYTKLNQKKFIEGKGQILNGFINLIDVNKLQLAMPQSFVELLQDLKIGSGYSYKGDIFLSSQKLGDISLLGRVEGKDFNLFGYELDLLSFDISYTDTKAIISKFVLNDYAFNLQFKELTFTKNAQDKWHFNLPSLRIEDLRPIRLVKDKQAMKTIKHLIVHEILVENLTGIVGDSSTIKGRATLNFEKIVKNTFSNILLAIPSDILSRIGLNLSVMTPAIGKIYFDIKDRRIYLLKLDGVYSEGKHSQFYLPKDVGPSYIDFDGNLNIYIKIKQYNLLMKLTEFLRMHIMGKWDSPIVNFEKNNSSVED